MEAMALLSVDLYCRTNGWYEVALQRATQALAYAEEAVDHRIAVIARIALSETERMLGRLPRAIEQAERALAALDDIERCVRPVPHQRVAATVALASWLRARRKLRPRDRNLIASPSIARKYRRFPR